MDQDSEGHDGRCSLYTYILPIGHILYILSLQKILRRRLLMVCFHYIHVYLFTLIIAHTCIYSLISENTAEKAADGTFARRCSFALEV